MQLIRNADIYAPHHLGIRDLLVAGERIAWIGTSAPSLVETLGVPEVDLEGARVIPGLIDCHVHLTGGGGESGARSRVPPLGLTQFTTAGVTTVIGVLGTDDVTREPGALLAAARALEEEGITAWCMTGGYRVPPVSVTGGTRSDLVHVDRFIAVGEIAISDHRSSQPSLQELLRLAADAHVAGMMTGKAGILHLHVGDGERGLDPVRRALGMSEIPPSTFHPTHVNRSRALFAEAVELVRMGVTIDVTSFPPREKAGALSAAEALQGFWMANLPGHQITVSSDAGGSIPTFDDDGRLVDFEVGSSGSLLETIRALLDDGHPLDRILPPFTANVAHLFRLHRKGIIEVAADADLVVLDVSGRVSDVMARGRWHVQRGLPVVTGTFE